MKKILLSALTIFTIISCSGDDTTNNENSTSSLSKEIITSYYQGETTGKTIIEYSDGKITKESNYNSSGTLNYYYSNTYNTNGALENSFIYDNDNNQVGMTKFYYDNLGRVIKREFDDNGTSYNKDITYNEDGTVTTIQSSNGAVTTYYINENNLVYKEVQGNNMVEVEYDGFNPVSIMINGTASTFSYHDTPAYANIKQGMFGSYKPNNVIQDGALDAYAQDFVTKYPYKTMSQNGTEKIRHEYIFNDTGLPVKRSSYYYGELEEETEYIYQ